MIRLPLLGATACLITCVAATSSFAGPSGYLLLGIGHTEGVAEGPSSDESFGGAAIEALAGGTFMFTPVLGVQGDVRFQSVALDSDTGKGETTSFDGGLHGFFRNENLLLGGLVQLGSDKLEFVGNHTGDRLRSYIGGEAQWFLDRLTAYVQGGWQGVSIDPVFSTSYDASGWFGKLEGRYFITDDLSVEARAGFDTLQSDGSDITLKTLTAGLGAEYKLADLPVSLFANYDYTTFGVDVDDSLSIDTHRIMIGARFAIGEQTLIARDRNGSSLELVDGRSMLSNPPNAPSPP